MSNKQLPGCIGFILDILGIKLHEPTSVDLPYESTHVLTRAELHFYRTLSSVVKQNLVIFSKVRMIDIAKVQTGLDKSSRRSAKNRVIQKHFDFVLCKPDSMRTILIIELDDSSHNRPSAQRNDEFKNAVLAKIGIPILRVRCAREYDPNELSQQIMNSIRQMQPEIQA